MTSMRQAKAQAGADATPRIDVRIPTVRVFTDDGSQVITPPTSHDEMMALIAQRQALTAQVDRISERRDGIVEQLRSAPEPAQAGMQAELKLLDQQVIQAQTDLANVERAISQTTNPSLISMAGERDEPSIDNSSFADGVAAGGFSVLFFMSALLVFLRRRWRKGGTRQPLMLSADSERLQRLEQGMDTMAVEIERISEGQRFVTRLMTESRGAESTPR